MRNHPRTPAASARILALTSAIAVGLVALPAIAEPSEPGTTTGDVVYAGGKIHVAWRPAQFAFTSADLLSWISESARAVTLFFGRFPVRSASLVIEPASGNVLSRGSATSGPEPRVVLQLARVLGAADLRNESVLVHEMTHLAMPALDMRQIWLQEGIATYVEFVARAQAGISRPEDVWARFVDDMPMGLPTSRDAGGLDGSFTPGRRYWGGAMFCLLADIEIRKSTGNRLGLQDALRAVQREGGNLTRVWSIDQVLAAADRDNGKGVMRALYKTHAFRPVSVDLAALWRDLGVRIERDRIVLDDNAPLADIRRAITERPSAPLLVTLPALVREARVAPSEFATAAGPFPPSIASGLSSNPVLRAPPVLARDRR